MDGGPAVATCSVPYTSVPLFVLIVLALPPISTNPTTSSCSPIAMGRCFISDRGMRIHQSRTIHTPDGRRRNSMWPPALEETRSCGNRMYLKSSARSSEFARSTHSVPVISGTLRSRADVKPRPTSPALSPLPVWVSKQCVRRNEGLSRTSGSGAR